MSFKIEFCNLLIFTDMERKLLSSEIEDLNSKQEVKKKVIDIGGRLE